MRVNSLPVSSVCIKYLMVFCSLTRMKPRKVKEDDAPRTIACPHKVSLMDCRLDLLLYLRAQLDILF